MSPRNLVAINLSTTDHAALDPLVDTMAEILSQVVDERARQIGNGQGPADDDDLTLTELVEVLGMVASYGLSRQGAEERRAHALKVCAYALAIAESIWRRTAPAILASQRERTAS